MIRVRLFSSIFLLAAAQTYAQNPAAPAAKPDEPAPAERIFQVPATLPDFFGAPAASKSVKPVEFDSIIPGELFLLKVGMTKTEIAAARQVDGKNMISEITLPEGRFFHKLDLGNEIVGNGGPGTATRATYMSFGTYGGKPPTREAVKKVTGLFYKTLGHPTTFRQSAILKSLVMEWDSDTHTVTLWFERIRGREEPTAHVRIKDKKLCTATWGIGQPKDLVESKPPAGAAGFKTFFEKWLATFLTEKEEKWALDQYERQQAAQKEREAKEKAEAEKEKQASPQ